MGIFNFWRSSPSPELLAIREELRLTRAQMEADRTAYQIQERRFKEMHARLFSQNLPHAPENDTLANEIKLRESWPGWFTGSNFGAIISPLAGYYDGITPLMSVVPTMWDYTLNLGFYVTEAWLDILRMYARTWYTITPQLNGVMKAMKDYIIHTGYEYQVQPKPGYRIRKSLVEQTQRIVDDFLTANQWFETEQDWFIRAHRDGEFAPRLFPQDSGVTACRTVEPWQIRGGNTNPNNLFGVNTAPEDREAVESYNVTYTGSTSDARPVLAFGRTDELTGEGGRMTLVKINTDKQVRRGVSDFLACQQLSRDLTTLLQNTQVGEALRQALVWVQETTGAANPLVEIGPNGNTPPAGYSFSSPTTWGPGQIPTMDKNLQFKDGPKGNAASAQIAAQLAYQALSVYFRVPEWMVSGTSAANFASSLTQESPLVRMAQSEQKFLKTKYGSVVRQAIAIAEEQEILEPGTLDRLELNVEATPLVVRDAKGETERNKTLHEDGVISKRTWSVREEVDMDSERENLEEERQYDAAHPAPTPPPQPGAPNPQEPNAPKPPDGTGGESTTAAAELARQAPKPEESSLTESESVQPEQTELREEQSRGQPGNAGQFGPGSGGKADAKKDKGKEKEKESKKSDSESKIGKGDGEKKPKKKPAFDEPTEEQNQAAYKTRLDAGQELSEYSSDVDYTRSYGKPIERDPKTGDPTEESNKQAFYDRLAAGQKLDYSPDVDYTRPMGFDTSGDKLSHNDAVELESSAETPFVAEAEPKPGAVAKVKGIARAAGQKALELLHRFNESTVGKIAMEGIDAIFDGPTDLKKLGYNPNTSSGTANPQNADYVKSNLTDELGFGISGHLVASLASKIIVKAVYWAKDKIKGKKPATAAPVRESEEMDEGDGARAWGDFISAILTDLDERFGLTGTPDPATIATAIRKLVADKKPKGAGASSE